MDLSSFLDTGSSSSEPTSDTSAAAAAPTTISDPVTTSLTKSIPLSTTSSISTDSLTTLSSSISSSLYTSSFSDNSSILSATTSSTAFTSTSATSTLITTTSSTSISSSPSFITSVQVTTVSNGGTQTITVINSITPTSIASPSTTSVASTSSSTSFWSNKGAIAGTFTVVALIGVAILIWAIMFIVRRRRANKLDRENEAAAAEAANATAPAFPDDDDHDRPIYRSDYLNARDGGGYGVYEGGGYTGAVPSASSHGTFNLPPMGLQSNENYPMAEFGSSLYPGVPPYPIVMTAGQMPQPSNYHDYRYTANETPSSPVTAARPPSGNFGVLDMSEQQQSYEGGGDVHTGTTHTTPSVSRGHSTTTSASHSQTGLSRNKSQGSRSLIDGYYSKAPSISGGHDFVHPNTGESYAAHYQPGFSGMPKFTSPSRRGTFGYDEPAPLPSSSTRPMDDEEADESDDEASQRKVLKVANE